MDTTTRTLHTPAVSPRIRLPLAALFRRAAACLFVLAPLFASPALARSVALVVGNNDYANVVTLKTAVGDAQGVGDALEKLGFVVRRATNVDRAAMSRALAAFEASLQPGDRAFFFYSGHGFEISGANYLLPVDVPAARVDQLTTVRDAAIPVEQIIDDIRARGARVAILVLDACRDNPFAAPGTRAAAISGGLARVDAPEGVFVLMSAGAKQEALDRLSPNENEKNSVFTRMFLRELAKPGLTLVQIAKATQVEVKNLAATVGYEQTPAYYDQVVGDVVLSDEDLGAPAADANPPKIAAADQPPARQQLAALGHDTNLGSALKLGGAAPIASFMRSNAGWTASISLPEPAIAIAYRIGDAGAYRLTGLLDALDQRTGRRMPNPSLPLPAQAAASIIRGALSDGRRRLGRPLPHPLRSGCRPVSRTEADSRADAVELGGVPRLSGRSDLFHHAGDLSLRDRRPAFRPRRREAAAAL